MTSRDAKTESCEQVLFQIPMQATLAELFVRKDHLVAVKYAVDVGAIVALLASLVGGLLPIPRILYAIAQDGLLPTAFGN